MKKLLFIMVSSSLIYSCSGKGSAKTVGKPGLVKGEMIASDRSQAFVAERPYGMVGIPGGSFVMGQADMDFTMTAEKAPLKTVTVSSFFMDEAEITNAQYREFIKYVRDSTARTLLAEKAGSNASDAGIGQYAYAAAKAGQNKTAYQEFLESKGGRDGYNENKKLDWKTPLFWKTSDYPDVQYAEVMESMYLPADARINNERIIDSKKLKYSYTWEDVATAAKNNIKSKATIKKEDIAVYPDTTVWIKDFNYAYNDPMLQQYFWHQAYKDYPVVGVKWEQARAFCDFRTKYRADYNASKKQQKPMKFRLPTEAEWEYAARGGKENTTYPWGGPYLMDDRGCYLANFKPKRGNYIEDEAKGNYTHTAPVKKYEKNPFGLFDMAGNVSEWTDSPFNNATYNMTSTMNPYLSNQGYNEKKKCVRGGSWKDVGYVLMNGYRDWEFKDSARSFIGFRTVQDVPDGYVKVKTQRTN
jgi:formylglycine-generating enzyme